MSKCLPGYLLEADITTGILFANATEALQDGRIHIEKINGPFLKKGGTPRRIRCRDRRWGMQQ